MNISVKQELLKYVAKYSDKSEEVIREKCTTNSISQKLMISRSLASQYLNELTREKKLIKINERPVIFLDRANVEKAIGKKFDEESFDDYEDFSELIKNNRKNFKQAVGFDGSLKECIKQVKTAVDYPGKGLPVIISGSPGCGKSFFADLLKEYFFEKHRMSENKKHMILHRSSARNTDDDYMEKQIFGYVQRKNGKEEVHKGALEFIDSGLLILDDIMKMNEECQEKLIYYLDTGCYTRIGEEKKILKSQTKVVLVTNNAPELIFTTHFLSRFPIVVEIPSLKERTIQEKREMIIHFLKEESIKNKKEIKISKEAVHSLIEKCESLEVLQLQQMIKKIIAKKIQDEKDSIVLFSVDVDADKVSFKQYEELQALDDFWKSDSKQMKQFVINLSESYKKHKEENTEINEWKKKLFEFHQVFNDYAIFQFDYIEKELLILEKKIQNISDYLNIVNNLEIGSYVQKLLARYYYLESYISVNHSDGNCEFQEELEQMEKIFPAETTLCKTFIQAAEQTYGIRMSRLFQMMTVVNLNLYNKVSVARKTLSLVICHGSSTATSMVNVVNTVLKEHVFDGIDMPFNTTFKSIEDKVWEYLKGKQGVENLLIAVDTGSLTGIIEGLEGVAELNIGIINNVSTGLLLDMGMKIQQDIEIEEILEKASSQNICKYRYVNWQSKKKEKVILFVGENGIDTAEQMRNLFERSIPRETEIKFISCDYISLKKEKFEHELLLQYDILFMEGIFNPEIPEIPFLPLGEIVKFNVMEEMDSYLSPFLSKEELEIFHQNLIKNFSLENLVESLTILNPTRLLNMVVDAITELSLLTNCKFREHTLIGLYVHTCCFVERMVTRTSILEYPNLNVFREEKAEFISKVNECFKTIKLHYHVEIPDSEAAYIYDYIKEDLEKKGI